MVFERVVEAPFHHQSLTDSRPPLATGCIDPGEVQPVSRRRSHRPGALGGSAATSRHDSREAWTVGVERSDRWQGPLGIPFDCRIFLRYSGIAPGTGSMLDDEREEGPWLWRRRRPRAPDG